MAGSSSMPWAELLGMLDLNAQGRDVAQKGQGGLQSALGGGSGGSAYVQPSSGSSSKMSDKLLDLFKKNGSAENEDKDDDVKRKLRESQAEIDKLDSYGGKNFGKSSLPEDNYGLNLGQQYKQIGE